MRIVLSSVLLAVFWFAVTNLVASAIAWLAASAILRERHGASILLAVRLMPAAASGLFVLAIFLPAHWVFEPPTSDERFGVTIGVLAALGAILLGRSTWRAVRVLVRDLQVMSAARQAAMPLATGAYEIDGVHGVSLAGVLRPTILVGSATVEALTPAELDAAIAHEVAHRRSGDNLKRFLIHCAPDVFGWTAAARRVEELWQAESECRADAEAVHGDERRAVVLASALVKVARLTRRPGAIAPSPAWSAFHVPSLLETRVARLVSGRFETSRGFRRLGGGIAAASVGIPAAVWVFNLSHSLHVLTETLVTRLP